MKKYIFITYDIHPIGGTQMYTAEKAKYLQKNGWKVVALFDGISRGQCAVPSLDQFVDGGIPGLDMQPECFFANIRNKIIKKMIDVVGVEDNDKVIVESQAGSFALWGEILAEKLQAKHFCFNCNEIFRRKGNPVYLDNLEFFDFKHRRKELAGVHKDSLIKLFDGFKNPPPNERYLFSAYEGEPIQNVQNKKVDNLLLADWNICYIGRCNKGYFDVIINDLYKLSKKHSDKKINIIFVGDINDKEKNLFEKFNGIQNVKLTPLGTLVPIPRELFSKVDIVIAGSNCAMYSAYEGVPTIVADARNHMANGLFGYDTFNTLYHEDNVNQTGFDVAVERVLVDKEYDGKGCELPARKTSEEYYAEHFALIDASEQKKEYYTKFAQQKFSKKLEASVKYRIKNILRIY